MNSQQRDELAALCPLIHWDADMAAYSTFRAGGTVEALVELSDADHLAAVLQWLHARRIPWQVIGGGSNVLFTSRRHEGVYIRLHGSVRDIDCDRENNGECRVRVHAGCSLGALVGWCMKNSLRGLEFMAGIPGSVGGAIRMNAGAFGHAIGEVVDTVRYATEWGEMVEARREEVQFAYRSTCLPGEPQAKMLITGGVFRLQTGDGAQIARQCREIIAQRKQKQPAGIGSAGSFFKNPTGDFAGRLIEVAGLKGLAVGKAMVSPKHANFIVNTGGAVPEDIVGLMEKVRQEVLRQSGVLLEPEVHIF
ncbi:UDP-N-acetylenolpyruvoylglucosamine reductase [Desulfobulbus propionicus DSM 2032]|uniref:UDP-N-acetylenolpyruvoylglucosamine reductase n=1 Tax=Desulfobulbus propionicus (strain ATCC 33891 / DSM 2032 / VKM B-1956 / 1pr3) TaxID=577650 RepID=A0A7U4DNB0_DESPD|nr:UDP-N-acetylmuramate dehydrogenase [Desulfobulbus propionicus]ADW16871.1 UDP-N-acetylenolpyruvoylglucosamine reductase [Desulfobulbus propionicus DSM 2032]